MSLFRWEVGEETPAELATMAIGRIGIGQHHHHHHHCRSHHGHDAGRMDTFIVAVMIDHIFTFTANTVIIIIIIIVMLMLSGWTLWKTSKPRAMLRISRRGKELRTRDCESFYFLVFFYLKIRDCVSFFSCCFFTRGPGIVCLFIFFFTRKSGSVSLFQYHHQYK